MFLTRNKMALVLSAFIAMCPALLGQTNPVEKIGTLSGKRITMPSAAVSSPKEHDDMTVQPSRKAEVLAALAERDKAFIAGDETKVAEFMSEDYLQTDVNGNIQDKQAWLREYYRPMAPLLKSGKTRWITFDRSDIVVRDLGDTFIVAGKQAIKHIGVDPANPTDVTPADSPRPPLTLNFTHVWIKRDGAWKLAIVHNAVPRGTK